MKHFIVIRDTGNGMVPASRDGIIQLFESWEAAQESRCMLDVVACVTTERLIELCQRHDLKIDARDLL